MFKIKFATKRIFRIFPVLRINGIAPFCNLFMEQPSYIDRDGDKMAPSVEKKLEELEIGLLHLQQNIDIPEITLTVHPVVAAVIKKSTEEGTKPKVADFGDRVEDPTFLNALQSGVNRWIREIQKVRFVLLNFRLCRSVACNVSGLLCLSVICPLVNDGIF